MIKIGDSLSIYEVASIKETLLNSLEKNNELILDLSDVTNCDTAGIQLLCSAKKTAEAANKTFEIQNISDAVKKAAICVGMNLEDW